MSLPLRRRLRDETRAAHDLVDAVFGAFDLTAVESYAGFLAAHHEALTALPLTPAPGGLPPVRLVPLLRRDLSALGRAAVAGDPVRLGTEAQRIGAYYVVAGSRMGAQLLSAQWAGTTDARVLAAGAYLSDRTMLDGWKALGTLLSGPHGLDADDVLTGARRAFGAFEAAGRRQANHALVGAA